MLLLVKESVAINLHLAAQIRSVLDISAIVYYNDTVFILQPSDD